MKSECLDLNQVPKQRWEGGKHLTRISDGKIVVAERGGTHWYGYSDTLPVNSGLRQTFTVYGKVPPEIARCGVRHQRAYAQRRVRRAVRQQRLKAHREFSVRVSNVTREQRHRPPGLRRRSSLAPRLRSRPSSLPVIWLE